MKVGEEPSIISNDYDGGESSTMARFTCFGLFFVFLRPPRVIRIILSPCGKRNKGVVEDEWLPSCVKLGGCLIASFENFSSTFSSFYRWIR